MNNLLKLLPILLFSGCSGFNHTKLARIHPGMPREAVIQIVGTPALDKIFSDREALAWAYVTWPGGEYWPVVLTNGLVSEVPHRIAIKSRFEAGENDNPFHERQLYVDCFPELDQSVKSKLIKGQISIDQVEKDRCNQIAEAKRLIEEKEAGERAFQAGQLIATQRLIDRDAIEAAELKVRNEYLSLRPDGIRKAIEAKTIVLGMTCEDVRYSWGKPRLITSSVSATGTLESWSFGIENSLQFVDGKLVSWTTIRSQ